MNINKCGSTGRVKVFQLFIPLFRYMSLLFFSAGFNCHTTDGVIDDIMIDFNAFQPGFALDTATDKYYNYTQCESLDTTMLTDGSDMAVEVDPATCRAVLSGDKAQYFSLSQSLSEAADGGAPPCGCTFDPAVSKIKTPFKNLICLNIQTTLNNADQSVQRRY